MIMSALHSITKINYKCTHLFLLHLQRKSSDLKDVTADTSTDTSESRKLVKQLA